MIRMEQRSGFPTEPKVICDTCGEEITEDGIVAWSQGDPWPAFYHKENQVPGCDRDDADFWIGLEDFVDRLRSNVLGQVQ